MSKYSNEFKLEVVKYCVDKYHGYTDVAKCFNIQNRGFNINHKTVIRLMKELGVQCFVRVQKYKSYKG